jgi:hypothetical protein
MVARAIAAFKSAFWRPDLSPFYQTIGAAISAKRYFVICECPACGQRGSVDMRSKIATDRTCRHCRDTHACPSDHQWNRPKGKRLDDLGTYFARHLA